jgi:hypothetical protein
MHMQIMTTLKISHLGEVQVKLNAECAQHRRSLMQTSFWRLKLWAHARSWVNYLLTSIDPSKESLAV